MKPNEVVLSVIPGDSPHQRILIVSHVPEETSHAVLSLDAAKQPAAVIELKQQSWGESVGWFTQHTISVQESQVASLRATLGVATAISGQNKAAVTRPAASPAACWTPRVVSADSA